MSVSLKVNPRDDSARYRKPFSSYRITVHAHRGLDRGDSSRAKRASVLEEALIQDAQDGQITIVSDKLDRGRVMLRIVFLFDHDESCIADNVRIGHDSIAVND